MSGTCILQTVEKMLLQKEPTKKKKESKTPCIWSLAQAALHYTVYCVCHLHECARKDRRYSSIFSNHLWTYFQKPSIGYALPCWPHEQCALTTAVLWSTLANPKVEMLLICAWAWFPSAALHYKHVQLFKKRQTAAFRAQSPQEHRSQFTQHSTERCRI